ncbi:MAG TPA: class I mannose-6-phosphate isomerase [Opitutaceae bacterium]|nr:class I mannose-6-phosphate isomerase [Opitutaceae bacterium]
MPDHRGKIILLPPNRVWRTYPGGRTLDALAGAPQPADSHLAEDWIASTTRAVNSGREQIAEGISQVRVGLDPAPRDFAHLLATDPEYFLGAAHVRKYGAQPQLLVKFLDSGTRLHFQVHPTREFAQRVLTAPSGKTEAYYVLGVRDTAPNGEPTGYIYVGFQRPPTPAQLRDYIVTQNIAAIEACFDRIVVRAGDTFIIPGGTPHALGAGVFMVEIQEPSDLVIRFEFERAGYVLRESARFMNRDVDFALTLFNWSPLTPADLETRVRCPPRRRRDFGAGSWQDELIGPAQTDCFRVARTRVAGTVVKDENSAVIAIVTAGTLIAEVAGVAHRINTYEKFFLPAGLGPVKLTAQPHAEILECFPPA